MGYPMVKIENIGKIITGNTPPKNKSEYYDEAIVPFIKPNNFNQVSISNLAEADEYLSLRGASIGRLVKEGAVLVTCIGTIGNIGIATKQICFNQQINAIIPNEKQVDNRYLAYAIIKQREQLKAIANAPVVPIINKTQFSAFEIPLPPLRTQKIIVEVLDRAQALIDARKEQIRLMDELIQSVFNGIFGDCVKNPKGWEVQKLKELTTKILSGNTPKGGEQVYVEEGIIFFRSQNVWRNRLELDDVAYIDKETHARMKNSSLKHKDILMTKTGRINTENSSLGRAALFLGEDDSANINGHVYLIRLQKCILHEFVLFILTTKEYREYIRSVCVGGIDKRQINKEHLEDFPIIMPPLELQQQFVEYIKKIEFSKKYMEQSLEMMKYNFNNLMDKAFNGEF